MNIFTINKSRILLAALCLVLIVSATATKAYAQEDDGSGGCSCDTGYADTSYSDSYAPSTGYGDTSYTDSYAPSTGYGDTSYTDSYTPDTGYSDTSYTDSYAPYTGYGDTSYTDSYAPSTGYGDTSYADSYTPTYSYSTPTYSTGYSYSTPSYAVMNPVYTSGSYTTPSIGYTSSTYVTKPTGSTPIYTPTPTTHTTTPTPVTYNNQTSTQGNTQNQTQTSSNNQPIVIENNNTNTNTVTNSAPVTQNAGSQPQTIVVYAQQPVTTVNQSVSCSIAAVPNQVVAGQSTVLSWTSYGATSGILSGGIGSVQPSGTITVRPGIATNYVLTVYGVNGGSSTCNVLVTVVGSSAPYVSLTQIPYTGFDFGPVGDTIYWIGLALFAMAAAYLMVYYRGGAFAFAGQLAGNRRSSKSTTAHAEAPKAVAPAEAQAAPAYVAPAIRTLPGTDMSRATADSMLVAHSKNGEIPRIVITRA